MLTIRRMLCLLFYVLFFSLSIDAITIEERWQLIRDKKITSVQQYIEIMKPTEPEVNNERKWLAMLIENSIDYLMSLEPTAEEIANLTRQNGSVSSAVMHMALKKAMIKGEKIYTPEEYLTVMDYGLNNPTMEYIIEVTRLLDRSFDYFYSLKPTVNDRIRLLGVARYSLSQAMEIRERAINDKAITTANEYIALMQTVHPIKSGEETILNAFIMQESLSYFMDLNPTSREIIKLLDLPNVFKVAMKLKEFLINNLRINTPEDYILIMDCHKGKKIEKYIELNTALILSTLENYIDNVFKLSGLNLLVPFLKRVLPKDENSQIFLRNMVKKIEHREKTFCQNQEQVIVDHLTQQIKQRVFEKDFVLEEKKGEINLFALWPKILPDRKQVHNEKSECPICFDLVDGKDLIRCTNPACTINEKPNAQCCDCFRESLALDIKENKFPLQCRKCKQEIALESRMMAKLGINDLEFKIKKGTILSYHQKIFKDAKNCSTPNCINRIRKNDCDPHMNYVCDFCGFSYCFSCHYSHPNMTCETYAEQKKNTLIFDGMLHDPRSNLRPCPYCEAPTEKIAACDHLKCKICQKEWDWKFGRRMGPVHHSKTDGTEPRFYRVAHDINQITGKNYTTYVENVSDDLKTIIKHK